ncbi:sce7726 family protein [Massilia sp. X63]|uniref:sce7726 family protein n=1 Tax=Massilia sp. X63 TaxID=3237285 RepID=UPI0034DDC66B
MAKIHASSRTLPPIKPVSEQEIREALLFDLKDCALDTECVQEELRLERGSSRIDVAVIGKLLVGYEIKSDVDTFARFSNQIHSYNRVFDQIFLVCGPRHVAAATKVLPSWWGICVAERDVDSTVRIKCIRAPKANAKQDSFSLASMLWREEALAMIEGQSTTLPAKASAHMLWEHIANSFPLESIKAKVSDMLLKRHFTVA